MHTSSVTQMGLDSDLHQVELSHHFSFLVSHSIIRYVGKFYLRLMA